MSDYSFDVSLLRGQLASQIVYGDDEHAMFIIAQVVCEMELPDLATNIDCCDYDAEVVVNNLRDLAARIEGLG